MSANAKKLRLALLFAWTAGAACGGGRTEVTGLGDDAGGTADAATSRDLGVPGSPSDLATPADAAPADAATEFPIGAPISAATDTWTWIDIAGAQCDDGSPTGIGVNLHGAANTVIYLAAGGACWNYETCVEIAASAHGPFGSSQFYTQNPAGSILDRTVANSPFWDWNYVYVPYCTSDVHTGDNVATYAGPNGASATLHHVGHANIVADLGRLIPTLTNAKRIVLAGSSAGGFGTLLNMPTVRDAFPNAETYLLDDSGPLLSEIPSATVDAWFEEWKMGSLVDGICGGPACRSDLSLVIPPLVAALPSTRMALLSSVQDATISGYFGLTPQAFQTGLLALASEQLDPTTTFKYFFITGNSHTMLANPASFTQNGTSLITWLNELVSDNPAWASIKP